MVAQCLLKQYLIKKIRLLFAEIDLNIIVYKSEKVHYTTNITDKFGKVMVWKV